MIPLYILGLLLRFGPQHGYQIKKLLEEQLEDSPRLDANRLLPFREDGGRRA